MATTKTLTPTNQAITLAEFTEKPDNRVNVNNDSKLADAINSLNSKIGNIRMRDQLSITASGISGSANVYGNDTVGYVTIDLTSTISQSTWINIGTYNIPNMLSGYANIDGAVFQIITNGGAMTLRASGLSEKLYRGQLIALFN